MPTGVHATRAHKAAAHQLSCMFVLPELLVLPCSSACVSHNLGPILSHELHPRKSVFQSNTCPDHNSLVWTLIFLFSCQVLMDENTEVLWSESAAEGTEEKTKQFLTLLQCDIIQKLQNNVCPVTLMCPAVLKLCSAVGSSDRL